MGTEWHCTRMSVAPLSLLALVAQALPGGKGMTTAEGIAVTCALLGLILMFIWARWTR